MSSPLLPDQDEGQEWAREELSRRVYSDEKTFLEWLVDKIDDFFSGLYDTASGYDLQFLPTLFIFLAVLALLISIALAGPMRRKRAMKQPVGGMWSEGDHRTAEQFWLAAEQAASNAYFSLAVIEGFRGSIRSLEEQEVIKTHAGMTAVEVSILVARSFPATRSAMRRAATLFDKSLYGNYMASAQDYRAIVDLGNSLHAGPQKSLAST